jgi:hypothetical protein
VEALNLDAKYLSGTPSASASLDMERTPSLPDEDAGGAKSGAESGAEPIPQPVTDAPREVGRVAFMDTQVPLADEVELAAAAPQKNMLRAWIMWGVPVFLMLFGIGFVLNIGVHWYYLGKNRRAQSATRIWSLTLVSFVALGLLSALGMEVLAGVLFVFLVIPLAAIQLIRAVKDASLLHKMSKQSARKDRRGSGSIV